MKCERCNGTGEIEITIQVEEGAPEMDVPSECPDCEGTGGPSIYEYTEEEISEFRKEHPEWFKK